MIGSGGSQKSLPMSSRRPRVLCVDDEQMICNTLRRLLSPDCDVITTTSAVDALDKISHAGEFDVVFCDLMMPQVTGMDLYAELMKKAPHVVPRIIFLTGGAYTPRARAFLRETGCAYIEKPFESRQIRAVVAERFAALSSAAAAEPSNPG